MSVHLDKQPGLSVVLNPAILRVTITPPSDRLSEQNKIMTKSASSKSNNTTAQGIPLSLAPWFQEYDLYQLDPATHQSLLIERTLAYGNRAELRWLFDTYGADQITAWVQRLGSRRLPWRRYNLWCVLLDLPPARRLRPEDQRLWPH